MIVLTRFGKVVRTVDTAGLAWKTPFMDEIVRFDRRLMTSDRAPQEFNTRDKKRISVDYIILWKIIKAEDFLTSLGGSQNIDRLEKLPTDD